MFEKWADKLREKAKETEEIAFRPYEDPASLIGNEAPAAEPTPAPVGATISAQPAKESNIELKVVRPASFGDVSTIADYLLEGCTVVLNLEALDRETMIRMLDFLNGVTYSTDGEIKQVAQTTYIITPNNVDVTDDNK